MIVRFGSAARFDEELTTMANRIGFWCAVARLRQRSSRPTRKADTDSLLVAFQEAIQEQQITHNRNGLERGRPQCSH